MNFNSLFTHIWETARQDGFISLVQKSIYYLNSGKNNLNNVALYQLITDYASDRSLSYTTNIENIYRIFNKETNLYQGLERDYLDEFLDCFVQKQTSWHSSKKAQENLIKYTTELDPLSLDCKRWLFLYYICIRSGFFRIAYMLRNKAFESAHFTSNISSSFDHLSLAFRGMIDSGDIEGARYYLNEIKGSYSNLRMINELESYYYLKKGDISKFQKIKENDLNHLDKLYQKIIQGKRIAIVGPAPSGEQLGDEIDSFDVVIRISYRGRDKMPDKNEFGKKVNISYYGNGFSSIICDEDLAFLKDLDFISFKTKKFDYQKQLIQNNKGRVFKRNGAFFNGSPLEANNILFDVLHFKPLYIKLFKINFFLSNITHYGDYHANHNDSHALYSNFAGLAHHDILSNLNFTKQLKDNGLIDVDTDCSRVINLKNYEYCAAMEKIIDEDEKNT